MQGIHKMAGYLSFDAGSSLDTKRFSCSPLQQFELRRYREFLSAPMRTLPPSYQR